MKIELITRKLYFMPHANARVEQTTNGKIMRLISYKTCVATVIGGWLIVNGLYSRTTRKHISAFMREFDRNFQLAKEAFEYGFAVNLDTLEKRYFKTSSVN